MQSDAPDNINTVIATAVSHQMAGDDRACLRTLWQARRTHSAAPDFLFHFANAFNRLGRKRAALNIIQKTPLDPDGSWPARLTLASLYNDLKRYDAARGALNVPSLTHNAYGLYFRSVIENSAGQDEAALDFSHQALVLEPENCNFLLHRAGLLGKAMRSAESAEDFMRVLALEPHNQAARKGAFFALTMAGRYAEAVPQGIHYLAAQPDDSDALNTLQVAMERRTQLANTHSASEAGTRMAERFGPPPVVERAAPSSFAKWPIVQLWRVVFALLIRETRTRFGKSRFGYAWVIFEPLAHIGVMIAIISLIGRSHAPPIGTSMPLFYFTGIIPYLLFTHTVGHLMKAAPENRPFLQFQPVQVFDVYIARAILEIITVLAVAVILLFIFVSLGVDIKPISAIGVCSALLLLWLFGFGVGLVNAVLSAFFPPWERIWGATTSILYFTSGTFYIPRIMPEWVRDILVWNPILQTIEMVRVNYFYEPYPHWLNTDYLLGCACAAMIIGVIVERVFRSKILESE